MDSVACEFVFRGINPADRAKLCSLVKRTHQSLDGLDAKIKRLNAAVKAKRDVLQTQVDQAKRVQAQEPQGIVKLEQAVTDAQARLDNYDAQVQRLTTQLNAYRKLPTVLSGVNKQIETLTQSLEGQAPVSVIQEKEDRDRMEIDEPIEANTFTSMPSSVPELKPESMNIDLEPIPIPTSIPVTPVKKVQFVSPPPSAKPPQPITRQRIASQISAGHRGTKQLLPDITAYTPASPTEAMAPEPSIPIQ